MMVSQQVESIEHALQEERGTMCRQELLKKLWKLRRNEEGDQIVRPPVQADSVKALQGDQVVDEPTGTGTTP